MADTAYGLSLLYCTGTVESRSVLPELKRRRWTWHERGGLWLVLAAATDRQLQRLLALPWRALPHPQVEGSVTSARAGTRVD